VPPRAASPKTRLASRVRSSITSGRGWKTQMRWRAVRGRRLLELRAWVTNGLPPILGWNGIGCLSCGCGQDASEDEQDDRAERTHGRCPGNASLAQPQMSFPKEPCAAGIIPADELASSPSKVDHHSSPRGLPRQGRRFLRECTLSM